MLNILPWIPEEFTIRWVQLQLLIDIFLKDHFARGIFE